MDRNPYVFGVVLDYLRTGKLLIPPVVSSEQVELELKHWKLHNNLANSLPTDVLERIFSFLPYEHRILELTRVCKKWRRIVLLEKPEVLVTYTTGSDTDEKKGKVGEESNSKAVLAVTSGLPPAKKPNLLNIDPPQVATKGIRVAVNGNEDQLIAFCRTEHMKKVLAAFWKSLGFTFNAHITAMTGATHHLVNVHLRNSDNEESFFKPLGELQGLQVLNLSNCPNITPRFLSALASAGTLRSLDIEGCPHLNGDADVVAEFEYLERLPMLESFAWRDGRQDSQSTSAFFHALRTCVSLKRLYVEAPLNLDTEDNCFELMCKNLTNLEDVEFDTEEFDPAVEILGALQQLKNLKRLQCDIFMENNATLENALLTALSNLPKLERFGTIHCGSRRFWDHFPTLPNLKSVSTYTYQPRKNLLQAIVNTISCRLKSLEVFRIVLENCHKVEEEEQKICMKALVQELTPLQSLKQIDVTGYHITSDLTEHPREQVRQALVKALPKTTISALGSCTDRVHPDEFW
ncbi:hypothetical protein SARC_07867 [Sphaeroforma arctica JP610]|uniref:F-box domain-containing protein n=1 Tax=Sphaeroforma arctica JP610 TaxID=667725 RepID=A0A0L0FSJ3_9EUKA|nr:hypothetical protein SARC_07867 [Sphaeroforma arctica JP610]KNC79740.1 hypothetical protein SARC_07867 [Sphaeroforma arctica JP610]|eukprot:XP_014153642.1 hypothetical protein SARC_07867 [Sphaeroforma arctica JP610]